MTTAQQVAELMRAGDAFNQNRGKTFAFAMGLDLKIIPLEAKGKATLGSIYIDHSWHPDKYPIWDNDLQISYLLEKPDLNIGVLFADNVVDVDLDSTDKFLLAALNHYLPRVDTPYKWGRKSKALSHLAYTLADSFDRDQHSSAIKALATTPDMRIELRGGYARSNFFSVMPGSIHSTDELVEWNQSYDPNRTPSTLGDVRRLLIALRRAACAAMVAAHAPPKGQRHPYFLALTGMLVRMYKQAEDAGVPENTVTHDEALEMVQVAQALIEDDDYREDSFEGTWRKFLADPTIPISGGAKFAEIIGGQLGQTIRNHTYRLTIDDDNFERAEAMLDRFIEVSEPAHGYIDLERLKPHLRIPLPIRADDMGNKFTRIKVPFGDKMAPLPLFLKHSNQVTQAVGMQLRPDLEDKVFKENKTEAEHGYNDETVWVNCWTGFAYKPWENPVIEEEVEPFLTYVREVICCGNEERFEWVMAWLADIFQDPARKPGTLLLLTGTQGSGKTMLGEIIGKIIGKAHYGKVGSVEDLTKEFNTRVQHKLFVQADETASTQRTSFARDLKEIVTGDEMAFVPKGKEAQYSFNPARYFFTSNKSGDALWVEAGFERRYTILEVSPKYSGNNAFWEGFVQWWDNGPTLRRIHKFLKDHKYEKKLIRSALGTEEKKHHQMNALPSVVQWVLERIADGYPLSAEMHQYSYQAYKAKTVERGGTKFVSPAPSMVDRMEWPNLVELAALNEDYHQWARSLGLREKIAPTAVAKLLNEIQGITGRAPAHTVTAKRDGIQLRTKLRAFPTKDELIDGLVARFPSLEAQIREMTRDSAPTEELPAAEEGLEF